MLEGQFVSSSNVECACTLGSAALSVGLTQGAVVGALDGVSTLRYCMGGFGSFSALLSISAIFCREFCIEFTTSKLGVVVKNGVVRMVIMHVSAYLKSRLSKPLELRYP